MGPIKGFRHWFHSGLSSNFWDPAATLPKQTGVDGIDILVHIRAGDLAFVETDGDYRYSPTISKSRSMALAESRATWIEPSQIFDLIGSVNGPAETKLVLHSDGYIRSHIDAYYYSPYSHEEVVQLGNLADRAMTEAFPGRSHVGECDENLQLLFSDALRCKVAIVTHLGLMIPKFYSMLLRHGYQPPALCVLYRQKKPEANLLDFSAFEQRVAFIDVDSSAAGKQLEEFLTANR